MLREWRRAAGLTQLQLARLACVSRATVSHVETGRAVPSVKSATKLCRALGYWLGCKIHTWELFPGVFHDLGARTRHRVALRKEA